MLYFAYGSNLNKEQMLLLRCPAARAIGALVLPDARLVFRGVADVIYEAGAEVHGGLWEITKACEAELDRYEGVRGGLYYKDYFDVLHKRNTKAKEKRRPALIYRMNRDHMSGPSPHYYHVIKQGFRDFGLPIEALRDAKALSRIQSGRRRREPVKADCRLEGWDTVQ